MAGGGGGGVDPGLPTGCLLANLGVGGARNRTDLPDNLYASEYHYLCLYGTTKQKSGLGVWLFKHRTLYFFHFALMALRPCFLTLATGQRL